MSTMYLVRHGQASLGAEDYDKLSATGAEQARRLGKSLAERGLAPNATFTGPLRRHRETFEYLAEGAREAGLALPGPAIVEALTEMNAQPLSDEAMRRVLPSCPDLKEQLRSGELQDSGRQALGHYVGIYEALMKRWVKGDFSDDMVSYQDFSSQVVRGVQGIMKEQGRQRTLLVVTSGGPVAMMTRLALQASAEKAVELWFALSNSALTELRYTQNKLSLVRFNDAGHLPHSLLTGI